MDTEKRTIIDYISVTFPLKLNGNQAEQDKSHELLRLFREFFQLTPCQAVESEYGVNNFRYQYILSDHIYLRTCGPFNNEGYRTCQLELKGEGCREFERLRPDINWREFLEFLLEIDCDFKRIDITIDDLSGNEITMEDILKKVRNGFYTSIFKSPPKYFGMIDTGLTINLGSRKSMIELCIYDKLLQQITIGNPCCEDYWCRFEMRYRQDKANNAVIDLLTNYTNPEDETYGLDLSLFARRQLYSIIDIKEDNNYSRNDQKKVSTEPKWNAFLDAAEKGELPKAITRVTKVESSIDYIEPKFMLIYLLYYYLNNKNLNLMHKYIDKKMKSRLIKTSRTQFNRFNQYLEDYNLPPVSKEEFFDTVNGLVEIF